MRSICRLVAAVLAVAAGAVLPAVAQAHNVTSGTLVCSNGHAEASVGYSNFTPVNGQRETITATYTNGAVGSAVPPADQSPPLLSIPGPSVPNGTSLGATLKWAEGTFTIKPVVLNCQPVTPPPPAPPPPSVPPPPVVPPKHPHPHVESVVLKLSFFNRDPQPFSRSASASDCRIAGPRIWLHGLVHWQVRCRNATVLPGWRWFVNGHLVRGEHWTHLSDRGRRLNSWLFDGAVWDENGVYGHYVITARGRIRLRR